jgi:hypothetical protein
MNKMITEDIIKRALDESIEEFMLEEANWKGWAGAAGSTLGNIGKNIWNGVKEYMNWRTNGQWNQKYNQYPIYNVSQFSELRYLYQWFNTQKQTLQNILNPQSPSQISRDSTKINQYEGKPNDFIARECTYQNFTKWAGQYIKNYRGLKIIDDYIYNKITKNYQNPQAAINAMDLNTFIKQTDYYNKSTGNRETTSQKQQLQNESKNINTFFANLNTLLNRVVNSNVKDLPNYMEYSFNNYFNNFFKIYLSSNDENTVERINLVKKYILNCYNGLKNSINNAPDARDFVKSYINYNEFIRSKEGKQYWYLQRQTGAYGNKNVY